MRPLPHTLYAIYLVTLFTTSTGTDTGNIYKKKEGKKVQRSIYREITDVSGITNITDITNVADIVTDITDIADIVNIIEGIIGVSHNRA